MKQVILILFFLIVAGVFKLYCQSIEIIELNKNLKTENAKEINCNKSVNLNENEEIQNNNYPVNEGNKKELPTKQLNNKNTEIVKCNNNDRKGLEDEK